MSHIPTLGLTSTSSVESSSGRRPVFPPSIFATRIKIQTTAEPEDFFRGSLNTESLTQIADCARVARAIQGSLDKEYLCIGGMPEVVSAYVDHEASATFHASVLSCKFIE